MIQLRSILTAADNSGARELVVIHVFGGSKRKFGRIGDIINAVVKTAIPNGQVKDSEIVKAIVRISDLSWSQDSPIERLSLEFADAV